MRIVDVRMKCRLKEIRQIPGKRMCQTELKYSDK